jgi:hypothetical protein
MHAPFDDERRFMSKVKCLAWLVYLAGAVIAGCHIFSHPDDHGWRLWLPWLELLGFGFVSLVYYQFCESGFRLWEDSIGKRAEQHRITWELAQRDLEKQNTPVAVGSETFELN